MTWSETEREVLRMLRVKWDLGWDEARLAQRFAALLTLERLPRIVVAQPDEHAGVE